MEFLLTAIDEHQGQVSSQLECPVALSLHRVFPEADIITATEERIRIHVNEQWLAYRVEKTTADWIQCFDWFGECKSPIVLQAAYLGEGILT